MVCVVCERVVGVINESALAVMLATDDIYICETCREQDEQDATSVMHVLAMQPPDHYAHLVSAAFNQMIMPALELG